MAHPQVIAERHSTRGPPPRTAVARMAVARLMARWEVARMAAGHPTLRWEHLMAAVGLMAAVRLTVAAPTAVGQAATTAEATAALVPFERPISGRDGVPIGWAVRAGISRWRGGRARLSAATAMFAPRRGATVSWTDRQASSLPRCDRRNHRDCDWIGGS
jgi:hypothetical protein